jgi:hypothetical protein
MEREIRIFNFLLASLLELKTDDTAEYWLGLAEKYADGEHNAQDASEQAKAAKSEALEASVEEIYAMYPTKCPNRGVSTGKCSKDKARIRTLLKKKSKEEIMQSVSQYLEDCRTSGQYLKNFGTLLNNLPEVVDEEKLFADLPTELPTQHPEYR